jgi:hypothetical protein
MGIFDFLKQTTPRTAAEKLRDSATSTKIDNTEENAAREAKIELALLIKERNLLKASLSAYALGYWNLQFNNHPNVRQARDLTHELIDKYFLQIHKGDAEQSKKLLAIARQNYQLVDPALLAERMLAQIGKFQNSPISADASKILTPLAKRYMREVLLEAHGFSDKLQKQLSYQEGEY